MKISIDEILERALIGGGLATARPGDELPELVVNPLRPGRYEPRVRKRRPKEYDLMTKPRDTLRKNLLEQSLGA